ncbi:hypothetical protein D3C59_16240 [Streptomyces sp. SHP22-7]|nr:hypothetical protein D3C59_16240 [Streptomyces sp. SHP22-7]
MGLPEDNVITLVSGTTRERILTAVRDAALATEDTLLVYFAGHGLRDPGERLHLALTDADPDFPQIGTLPYRQLRDLIRHAGHRARHRVTVLDCCYSGIAGGMSHATAPTRDELATALDEPTDGDGTHPHGDAGGGEADAVPPHPADEDRYGDCVLTSAPAESRSFVRPGARYPEFTGELIATLEAGIAGGGPVISLERTWRRVRDRMRARRSPEPQQFAHNSATHHIHFLNRSPHAQGEPGAGAPAPVPPPVRAPSQARRPPTSRHGTPPSASPARSLRRPTGCHCWPHSPSRRPVSTPTRPGGSPTRSSRPPTRRSGNPLNAPSSSRGPPSASPPSTPTGTAPRGRSRKGRQGRNGPRRTGSGPGVPRGRARFDGP